LGIGLNGYVLTSDGTTAAWAASTGGVTSFSAGSTGLTPNTATTGAVSLGGTLAIASGGTGQTTATAAFDALAPSQTSNSGKYLTTNGTTTSWAAVEAGATGGGTDDVFYENSQTVTTNYTISTNKNALSTGPISINSGIAVTIPSGSNWVVL